MNGALTITAPKKAALELNAIFENATVGILFTHNRKLMQANRLHPEGLAHPRYAGIFRQTHDVATLYREAARSMSIISALLDADPAPPAARRRVGVVGSTRSEALQGRPG